MGENPSSPEDGLEDALRRGLSDAVSGVEPSTDGLDKIRTRIDRRPPRSWLISVLTGAVERVRFWTWRGHWAWPEHWAWPATWAWPRLPHARAYLPWRSRRPRHRKGPPPGEARRRGDPGPLQVALGRRRVDLLWLTGALAGITIFACVSMGVQPFRQAINQASTVFQGGDSQPGGGGTHGTGARTATDGSGVAAGGGTGTAGPGQPGSSGLANRPSGVPSRPASPGACQPPASGNPAQPGPADSGTAPTDSGPASVTAPPAPWPTDSATPDTTDTAGAGTAYWSTGTATPDTGTWGTVTPDTGAGTVAATSGTTTTPNPTATGAWTCAVTPSPSSTTPAATPAANGATSMPTSTPADTPASTDPASTDPASTDPASTDPASTDPASTDPADPPSSLARAGHGDSSARLAANGSWRMEARPWTWHDGRRPGRR